MDTEVPQKSMDAEVPHQSMHAYVPQESMDTEVSQDSMDTEDHHNQKYGRRGPAAITSFYINLKTYMTFTNDSESSPKQIYATECAAQVYTLACSILRRTLVVGSKCETGCQ